jgi:hypothetical protein
MITGPIDLNRNTNFIYILNVAKITVANQLPAKSGLLKKKNNPRRLSYG